MLELERDEDASGFPLGFIVAGMVMVASVATILSAAVAAPDGEEAQYAAGDAADARLVLDLLTGRPGDWPQDPDDVTAPGLQNPNGTGLDLARIDLLRNASIAAADNDLVDRDELMEALGLDPDAYGLHLRLNAKTDATPKSVGYQHPQIRTAYIGDWTGLASPTVAQGPDAEMVADARTALEGDVTAAARSDRDILVTLEFDFDDAIHIGERPTVTVDNDPDPDESLQQAVSDASLLEGDVYPDDKQYLDTVLADRLDEYGLLIVGTNVDHNALTSNAVKDSIATWVRAGGILLVFGSADAKANWIQPLYHVTTTNTNEQLAAPDPDHTVLTHPHELEWQTYDTTGVAWDLDHVAASDATRILDLGDDSALAYLEGEDSGDGTVILSSLDLNSIVADQGDDEVEHLLTNVISRLHPVSPPELELEYGDEIPQDLTVSYASHGDVLWSDEFDFVAVELQVLLWRTQL